MQKQGALSRYIGDRAFYRRLMRVALPIMLQNGITNLVSLLDNIMVGAVGTEQMTGVSIVNQLLFVFNLCIFGGLSGAGIFTAQFYGRDDHEGVRSTFRFKMLLALGLLAVGTTAFSVWRERLIALYLHEGSETGDLVATAAYGASYLRVMLWGLAPFAVQQVYATTLRECGETLVPMKAGLIAIAVNLTLNYVLIFGHFGAPAMGAAGAALATVIARYVECVLIVGWTHRHPGRMPFIREAYRSMRVPANLTSDILKKGMPLLINEALWSAGMATLTQSYSVRGLNVVAAFNISNTLGNVMNVSFIAMGSAIAIIIGQELGAGRIQRIRQEAEQLAFASVILCSLVGMVMFAFAGAFPQLYNTEAEVRALASGLICISAICMPIYAYENAAYFTIRSGGRVLVTFLFDSLFCWAFSVPAAFILARYTYIPILTMFFAVQMIELIKVASGYILVRKGIWINNLT